MSGRLCKESALRAKQDEQNVKIISRGAVGALWRRMEAEARSIVQIAEDGGGGEARIGRRTEAELCGATEDRGVAAEQVAVHL